MINYFFTLKKTCSFQLYSNILINSDIFSVILVVFFINLVDLLVILLYAVKLCINSIQCLDLFIHLDELYFEVYFSCCLNPSKDVLLCFVFFYNLLSSICVSS